MNNPNLTYNDNGPMLNAYPDSMGGTLRDIAAALADERVRGAFQAFYILPSVFNTDLDRGFSIIDYALNELYAGQEDLDAIAALGMKLKLDFVLNHASVLSPQFQDLLKNGESSRYKDFFIDWNAFWQGKGEMTEEGYIKPDQSYIKDMFFRKPGLPILMVRMPDGSKKPYWNTFYQQVDYPRPDAQDVMRATGLQYASAAELSGLIAAGLDRGDSLDALALGRYEAQRGAVTELMEAGCKYLGQMDLNIKSPLVWEHYEKTLDLLAGYGASIVRLDAFAYAPKEPGARNFLNDPGTWELLEKLDGLAKQRNLALLPEIHASYAEGIYSVLAQKGYMVYDFFLPGLVLDMFERRSAEMLVKWANELTQGGIRTVNMLGCHDGIPLLDLKGLLPDERIQALIDTVVARGGYIKNLHGQKNVYYQVNATYFSALGEDERRMLLARAVQLFMPGKPQVWYLDLFAGKNDHEAVARAGAGGHKEINRTNLSGAQVSEGLEREVTAKQLELMRFRNTFPAFGFDAQASFDMPTPDGLTICWHNNGHAARLDADLTSLAFTVTGTDADGRDAFRFNQE